MMQAQNYVRRLGAVMVGIIAIAGQLNAVGQSNLPPAIPGPAGVFVIGDTHWVTNEVAKFDVDYISGYTLRVPWADLESWDTTNQTPRYNFSRIDATLEDLRARGKRMTLEIFIAKAPGYILDLPGTITWTNPHPTQGGIQVVPWDTNALTAYRNFITNLAQHVVTGTPWRVAEHPTLESVDASIVGLQGLRELSNTLIAHPDYDRERFIAAIEAAVAVNREAFATKFGFLALFAMDDNVSTPPLDETVYTRLMTNFNVAGRPTLGFFQETLSDTGPQPAVLGQLLRQASEKTYVMFQALRPWTLPPGTPRPPEIASGTPVTGLWFAWTNYHSTYVELYGADILAATNTNALRQWNHFFPAVNAFRTGAENFTLRPEAGGARLEWSADALLNYQLWRTPDLTNWELEAGLGPLTGSVHVPIAPGDAAQFFQLEVLPPAP